MGRRCWGAKSSAAAAAALATITRLLAGIEELGFGHRLSLCVMHRHMFTITPVGRHADDQTDCFGKASNKRKRRVHRIIVPR